MEEQQTEKKTTTSNDVEENKIVAAVGYFGLLCFIPLLLAKDSPFAQFHARQGLVLFFIWIAVLIISSIPFIGWILSAPLNLVMLAIAIIGALKAYKGEKYRMPLLADLADKLNI